MNEIENNLQKQIICSAKILLDCYAVYENNNMDKDTFYSLMTEPITDLIKRNHYRDKEYNIMYGSKHYHRTVLMNKIFKDNEKLAMKLINEYPNGWKAVNNTIDSILQITA